MDVGKQELSVPGPPPQPATGGVLAEGSRKNSARPLDPAFQGGASDEADVEPTAPPGSRTEYPSARIIRRASSASRLSLTVMVRRARSTRARPRTASMPRVIETAQNPHLSPGTWSCMAISLQVGPALGFTPWEGQRHGDTSHARVIRDDRSKSRVCTRPRSGSIHPSSTTWRRRFASATTSSTAIARRGIATRSLSCAPDVEALVAVVERLAQRWRHSARGRPRMPTACSETRGLRSRSWPGTWGSRGSHLTLAPVHPARALLRATASC